MVCACYWVPKRKYKTPIIFKMHQNIDRRRKKGQKIHQATGPTRSIPETGLYIITLPVSHDRLDVGAGTRFDARTLVHPYITRTAYLSISTTGMVG